MPSLLKNILRVFFIPYATIVFLAGLVVVFTLAILLSASNSLTARKTLFSAIKVWSRVTLFLTFAPIKLYGRPPGGRYVMVCNHISYIDPINLFSARPEYFKALGKAEIAKMPLFGFIYKRNAVLVDRSSQESRTRSMHQMREFLMKEGNIFVYPEGTFNSGDKPLKDFYDGAFRLAIAAQVPIVPLVLPDAAERWPCPQWYRMFPGRNRAAYLDPVPTAGMTQEDLPRLKQHVYDAMTAALVKYQSMP